MTELSERYGDIPAVYALCEQCGEMAQSALIRALPTDAAMGLTFYCLDRNPKAAITALSNIRMAAIHQDVSGLDAFLRQVLNALMRAPAGREKRRVAENLLKFTDVPGCAKTVYAAFLASDLRTIRRLAFEHMPIETGHNYADALERELVEKPVLWVIRAAIRVLPLERLDANWQVLWEHGKSHERFALLRRGMAVPLTAIDAERDKDRLGWTVWRLLREHPVSNEEVERVFLTAERDSSVAILFHGLAQAGKHALLIRLSQEYSSGNFGTKPVFETPDQRMEYDPFLGE